MKDRDVHSRTTTPYWRPPASSSTFARRTCSWLLALGVLALVVFSVLSENGLGEYLRLCRQRDRLEQDLEAVRAETTDLQDRLEALRTEPFALEKLARERYNMRREGEEVLHLVPERQAGAVEGRERGSAP